MSSAKAKPYKLKPSDGPMSRDDVSLWEYTLLAACRQVADWIQFLPGGAHSNWTPTDQDITNGLHDDNAAVRNKLRSDFANFLTCVATHCPTGFINTVMRESSSFADIVQQIKTTYGLDSKGEKFLSCMDLKLEFSNTFTYEQGYMQIKDFFMSSLLPQGARFKNRILDRAETLSPLAENFIMKEFLIKIHPKLPEHIKSTKGHLFTIERPTLACNKSILIDMMDSMLAEIENADSLAAANISVGQIGQLPYNRTRNNMQRGRGNYNRRFRGSRPPFPVNSIQGRPENCLYCIEAKLYDSSRTHSYANCPLRLGQAGSSRQYPKSQSNAGLRVFFVQDNQQTTQPASISDLSYPALAQQHELQTYQEFPPSEINSYTEEQDLYDASLWDYPL